MQADGGLVKHKDNRVHLRDYVGCQKKPLNLAAGERGKRAGQRQVEQTHINHAGEL